MLVLFAFVISDESPFVIIESALSSISIKFLLSVACTFRLLSLLLLTGTTKSTEISVRGSTFVETLSAEELFAVPKLILSPFTRFDKSPFATEIVPFDSLLSVVLSCFN